MMMMPGLTEEECQRYQELLEIKCQYERHSEKQPKEKLQNEREENDAQVKEDRHEEDKERDEDAVSSSAINSNKKMSEHEMALIEEELRHLEFKCRNILRAQKMQQLREKCMKAWMMEVETAAAARPGPPETGNHDNKTQKSMLVSSHVVAMLFCLFDKR